MVKHVKNDDDLLIRNSSIDFVRDLLNVGKVKRIFRVGGDIIGAAAPFLEKPNTLNAIKSAFLIGKVIVDDMEIWPDDYFDEKWECPYPQNFNKIVLNALINKPYKLIRTSDESVIIYMVHLGDVKVGYTLNTKTGFVDRIYVETIHMEAAKAAIKAELWSIMKDDNIVLRHVRRPNSNYENDNISLDVDDAFRPMGSKRASEYGTYLKKCIDAGVPRSVLFYGPPGTGKSTMARTIVDDLGMKSFRIRVEDIGHLETATIFEAINIFEPDAVILDDFDRSDEQAQLLETLEFFQRHVKLVIATVNDKNKLDEAILRPGRFDELVQIKRMDDDVVKAVLGQELGDSFDIVKEWPIAFIQEYVKRLHFMTPDEAERSTKELAARVKRLSKYDDDDDEAGALDRVISGPASKKSTKEDDVLNSDWVTEQLKKSRRRRKK